MTQKNTSSDEAEVLPAVVVGLGPLGRQVVSAVLRHPELELAGAVDPGLHGRSLAELVRGAPALPVAAEAAPLFRQARGGVAFVCTGSILEEVAPLVLAAVRAGLDVVSSCEELANAAFVDPELAEELDRAARRSGVAILGTGVAPGFVLDRLPATVGGVVGEVRSVQGGRVIDLAQAPQALLERAGVGLDPATFESRAEEGRVGHIGLSESCALLVEGLGIQVDEIEEELDPVVAEAPVEFAGGRVEAGRVRGVRQVAIAFEEGREVARLTLEMGFGAEPRDWFRIDGDPPIEVEIPGGVPGERATAWALVNAAPAVAGAEPGLLTVLDLPAGR